MIKSVYLIKDSSKTNWSYISTLYKASCYCISINTDMESYIELEGEETNCYKDISAYLLSVGWYLENIPYTDERLDVPFGGGLQREINNG